jgi:hypothetical protein
MAKAIEPTTTNPSRRARLAGAPVAAAAALAAGTAVDSLAVAVAASSAPDPIFALIAEHRAAVEDHVQAMEEDAGDEIGAALHEAEDDARKHLRDGVVPTIFAGVTALLAYVADNEDRGLPLNEIFDPRALTEARSGWKCSASWR